MSETSPLSKVRNRDLVAERQAHLISVATDLMARQGFHKTTVRQIAQATGWTMPMLYMYIRTKEDVLYLCVKRIQEEVSNGIEQLGEIGNPLEDLVTAAWTYFKAIDESAAQMALMYREIYSVPYKYRGELIKLETSVRDLFARHIHAGVQNGRFSTDNVDLVAYNFVILAHMWALKRWAFDEKSELRSTSPVDFQQYADFQIRLLLASLGVQGDDVAAALARAKSAELD